MSATRQISPHATAPGTIEKPPSGPQPRWPANARLYQERIEMPAPGPLRESGRGQVHLHKQQHPSPSSKPEDGLAMTK